MSHRYTATFTSVARIVNPSEQDRFVAKASLAPLRNVLPADVDPLMDPDLLYISCDGAVGGLVNRNGDGITAATAVAIHRSARHKYISMDHDRNRVAGVVLFPTLTTLDAHKVLTDDEALALNEPFNMSFAGVIWKVIQPQLSKYLIKVGDALDSDALSMSWEIGFDRYSVAVGGTNLFDSRIIEPEDPTFAAYDAMLRSNKGEGVDPSGRSISRIISDDAVILGYSAVPNPAAHVKGILPLTFLDNGGPAPAADDTSSDTAAIDLSQIPESQRSFFEQHAESGMGYHLCDLTMEDGTIHSGIPVINHRFLPRGIDGSKIVAVRIAQKSEEKNITSSVARVTPDTANSMKIESLEQIGTALGTHEAAAAVSTFVKAIQDGSAEYVKQLAAKENVVKNAEQALATSEQRAKDLEASIATLRTELEEIRSKAEQTEADTKFQERMASFDEQYNLDDEDRALIASDIKPLDDEAFAAYAKKQSKLMGGKKKAKADPQDGDAAAKKDKKPKDAIDDDGDDNDDGDDEDHKGKKSDDAKAAKAAEVAALVKEALASVIADKGSSFPASSIQVDAALAESMAGAFKGTFKIDGKTTEQRAAARAAKKQKQQS